MKIFKYKKRILHISFALCLLLAFSFYYFSSSEKIDYSAFITEVKLGKIDQVSISGNEIFFANNNGKKTDVFIPMADPHLLTFLLDNQVTIIGEDNNKNSVLNSFLISILPILLIVFVWFFVSRKYSMNNKFNPFGKKNQYTPVQTQIKITFSDVAGCDEAKDEVYEVVKYLQSPKRYQVLGGKLPKGILLVGPPGTGKTLLAKAIAGEAKVPFYNVSGSHFIEMFAGIGASRIRLLFDEAKKQSSCIIFIDEIDAIGKSRGQGVGSGNEEREQTLNQLLVEMDGFTENQNVIVIAATNRPDVLDPALLRPGRFDRQINVGLPDIQGREHILKVHTKSIPLAEDINISAIAKGTPGFSGADLANLMNEAALFAAKYNKNSVSNHDVENAKDKILLGTEHRTLIMTDFQRESTAYHESGHAIVGYLMPEHDPVHKITILPRGKALGVTFFLPENDAISANCLKLESQIATLYGGRVAEEIIYGFDNTLTGASNDIKVATNLARKMVTEWGFSQKIGVMQVSNNEQEKQEYSISNQTQYIIDSEIKSIITRNYDKAKQILIEHIDILHEMKNALLKYETLDSTQIDDLMNRRFLR